MSDSVAPAWLTPRTAYIHIPFCAHHCGYCDFAVSAGQDHLIELYLDAIEQEIATLNQPHPVETLFIGGGTPTHLSAGQLDRFLNLLNHWLPRISLAGEYSIESTPESITPEKIRVLADHGVNRVSIGVQSFQEAMLSALDRRHGVQDISRAVHLAREQIPRLSLDLIFGAPGQSVADWDRDLTRALELNPDHLSTYGLTYEKGTPLWKARERGRVRAVTEDDELAMYLLAIDTLEAAGFEHYEISNFARPGQRSIHNQRYWANEAYFGFGVGAARYVDGVRELNVRDTRLYIQRILAGESPTFQSERLVDRDRAFETIGTQLRRADGIHRHEFQQQTGLSLDDLIADQLEPLIQSGLITDSSDVIALTRPGRCVVDAIIEHLMKANVRDRPSSSEVVSC